MVEQPPRKRQAARSNRAAGTSVRRAEMGSSVHHGRLPGAALDKGWQRPKLLFQVVQPNKPAATKQRSRKVVTGTYGEMAERSNASAWKVGGPSRGPRVRIPLSPPKTQETAYAGPARWNLNERESRGRPLPASRGMRGSSGDRRVHISRFLDR